MISLYDDVKGLRMKIQMLGESLELRESEAERLRGLLRDYFEGRGLGDPEYTRDLHRRIKSALGKSQ